MEYFSCNERLWHLSRHPMLEPYSAPIIEHMSALRGITNTATSGATEAAAKAAADAAKTAADAAKTAADAAAKTAADAAKAAATASQKAAADAAKKAAAEATAKATAEAAAKNVGDTTLQAAAKTAADNLSLATKAAEASAKSADELAAVAKTSSKTADDASAAAKTAKTTASAADEATNAGLQAQQAALKAGKSADAAADAGRLAKAGSLAKKTGMAALGGVGLYLATSYIYGKIKQEEKEKEYQQQRDNAKECYAKYMECRKTKAEDICMVENPCMKEAIETIKKEQPEWWNCYQKCYDDKIKSKTSDEAMKMCSESCKSKEKHAQFQCPPFTPQFICSGIQGLQNFFAGAAMWLKIAFWIIVALFLFWIIYGIIKLFKK